MKLASDTGDFIELEPRAEPGDVDLALVVRVSLDGFIGESKPWVERHSWFAFAQALTILEDQRSGEAHVESMSPGEFALTIKGLDPLGHLGVEGLVGRHEFDRKIPLQFSIFAFEPIQIVAFARGARRLSEALGSVRSL